MNSTDPYTRACVLHQEACANYTALIESGGSDTEADGKIRSSVTPGLYEHWKSKDGDAKFYVVYGAAPEQDVYTPLVTYRALYMPHAKKIAFRHLIHEKRGFLTPVDRDGYRGPRFMLVEPLSEREICTLLDHAGELSAIKASAEFRMRAGELLKKKLPLF